MSQSIWTRCGGRSNARRIQASPYRLVESQFVSATRKLVDSEEEQAVLEGLIERVKPPVPGDVAALGLHYLLSTPFRHPPLLHGSRFGERTERGIFYGAREEHTCLAEVAYYRLVFISGTTAALDLVTTQHTAFRARVRAERGVDLTRPPFLEHRAAISSRTEYAAAQALGAAMRADGVQVALYFSARAPRDGIAVAVLDPAAFVRQAPFEQHEWICTVDREKVEMKRRSLTTPVSHTFHRRDFEVGGRLPAPALR